MTVLRRIAGTILLLLALMVVIIGLQQPGKTKAAAGVLDSPEASGALVGTFMFAIVLCIGGAWLWQKPKGSKENPTGKKE